MAQSDGYQQIKQKILNGELEMGARLVEMRLAEDLGLSRTPVREALRRLTSDRLVKFSPNRGYEVVSYTPEEVVSIYSCRALLESEAVRVAIQSGIDEATLHYLEDINERVDRLFEDAQSTKTLRAGFLALNHDFHNALYDSCPNTVLRGLITQTTEIPVGIRSYFRFSDTQLTDSQIAHKGIVRAARAGDSERAAALMREHIWTAKDHMISETAVKDSQAADHQASGGVPVGRGPATGGQSGTTTLGKSAVGEGGKAGGKTGPLDTDANTKANTRGGTKRQAAE